MGPHAGEAVGLQLQAHAQRVHGALRHPLAGFVEPGRGAHQVLQVVAHLVGDDVGLREVARGAEALGQILLVALGVVAALLL